MYVWCASGTCGTRCVLLPKLPSVQLTEIVRAAEQYTRLQTGVEVTKLLAGEKLHEEMLTEEEAERVELGVSYPINKELTGILVHPRRIAYPEPLHERWFDSSKAPKVDTAWLLAHTD